MSLYSNDAVLESPLVLFANAGVHSGILRGRSAIRSFFAQGGNFTGGDNYRAIIAWHKRLPAELPAWRETENLLEARISEIEALYIASNGKVGS
ncbi:MAG: hypothetical protein P8011_01675 [Acidihalobacter sp.]|uniref:hypothetical protein n=1 Tax=Acidihalobacter sp. TaxID=1872108 RepID=UPI00307EB2E2